MINNLHNVMTRLIFGVILLANVHAYAATTAKETSEKIAQECAGDPKDDCIVRKFKDSKEASLIRGKIAYSNYCVLCHGKSGEGDGRAARIHNPKPANLTLSMVPPEYVEQIIRKGGKAMGRSQAMPPWGEQLTDEQIRDVIIHLMSIRKTSP